MNVWGINPQSTYFGQRGRELWMEGKQVQKEEAGGPDGSFVHHKPLVNLFTHFFHPIFLNICYALCSVSGAGCSKVEKRMMAPAKATVLWGNDGT